MPTKITTKGALSVIIFTALVMVVFYFIVQAPSDTLSACQTEDQTSDCYWDATVQGNGQGQSFTVQDGEVIYE